MIFFRTEDQRLSLNVALVCFFKLLKKFLDSPNLVPFQIHEEDRHQIGVRESQYMERLAEDEDAGQKDLLLILQPLMDDCVLHRLWG
jgi:hypothetical protein